MVAELASGPVAAIRGLPLLPERGVFSLVEIGVFLIAIGAAFSVRTPHLADVAILTFLWAGLALAWNIAGGYANLVSFGHAAFFGIGAYTSTILAGQFAITPWLGLWAGAGLAGLFGAFLAVVFARLRGPFFILSTLAAAEVVRIGALNWTDLTGGPEGLSIPPTPAVAAMVFSSKTPYVLLAALYMILLFALSKWIERSRYGYSLAAIRDDEDAAAAAGINPAMMRVSAMALSAFATAIGGSLFAQYFLYLDPTYVVSAEFSFQFALLAALGGLGTAIGPVLGSFIITPLSELLRSMLGNAASGVHLVIYSIILLVVMLYFPGGLAALLRRARLPVRRGE
jgi:branched-chain amino acid transport system permease protein